MPEGSIPDPRMNPIEEKAFGFAFQHDDGHYYVYVKNNSTAPNPTEDSRYFTAGTRVELGGVTQTLLVVPKVGDNVNISEEDEVAINKFLSDYDLIIKRGWDETPVIFELIDVVRMSNPNAHEVLRDLNTSAIAILNK